MGRVDEMRSLAEDIVGAFEARVADLGAIKTETSELLKDFHNSLDELAAEGKKQRLLEVKARVSTVEEMLASFDKALSNTAKETRETFAESRSVREREESERKKEALADGKTRLADIKARAAEVREQAEAVTRKLEEFGKAHADMATELRNELKEANQALKEEVSDFLGELSRERQEAAAIWQNIFGTIRAKRGAAPSEPPLKATPPPPIVEDEEMTIEERIIEFLEAHPEGVKVGEMEEPVGVSRTRLGVICKRLWDEGEIRKENNLYFPL